MASRESAAKKRAQERSLHIHVRCEGFEYNGPQWGFKDALHMYYQTKERHIQFSMENNGVRFSYDGDGRHLDDVREIWEEHCTEAAGMRAWKDEHSFGRRVVRFVRELISVLKGTG